MNEEPHTLCPRCGKQEVGEFPATSRRDNKTYICNSCGSDEALLDYARNTAGMPKLTSIQEERDAYSYYWNEVGE